MAALLFFAQPMTADWNEGGLFHDHVTVGFPGVVDASGEMEAHGAFR